MQRNLTLTGNGTRDYEMILEHSFLTDIQYNVGQQNIPLSRTVCILLAIVCIITFVIGTIGNASVLALFIRYKSLQISSNILIINLTVADLLMCIFSLPMLINNLIRQDVDYEIQKLFCNINTFLGAFTGFLSIWSLVCLAFERCIVITRSVPIRHSSDQRVATFVIICIWMCSLVAAGIPFLGYGRYSLEGLSTSCEKIDNFSRSYPNIVYNILIQVMFFIIPIICITSCYFVIFIKVRNHEKNYLSIRKSGQFNEVSFRRMRKGRKFERSELKTAKIGIILISVFCLSWAPFSVVSWIGLVGNRKLLTHIAVALPAIAAKLVTIMNPLLYALMLQSFKVKLTLFFKQCFKRVPTQYGSVEDRNNYGHEFQTTAPPRPKNQFHFAATENNLSTPV